MILIIFFGVGTTITPELADFITFYKSVVSILKNLTPLRSISTKISYNTLSLLTANDSLSSIFTSTDIIAFSYYLMNPGGNQQTLRSPSVVVSELTKLIYNPVFLGKRICITNTGHPSSRNIGSSTDLQKNFVENINEVAQNNENFIHFIRFNFINDLTSSDATTVATNSFGVVNNRTVEYFRTMGLRDQFSNEKPAWCIYKDSNVQRSVGASVRTNSSFCNFILYPPPTKSDPSVGDTAATAILFFSVGLLCFLLILLLAPGELMKICKIGTPQNTV